MGTLWRGSILLLCFLTCLGILGLTKSCPAITWEAEYATPVGQWRRNEDPQASGGAYLESVSAGTVLEFHFRLERPTTLAVYPLWWRSGWRSRTKPFPHPLPCQPGPDALAALGERVFFTCPANGRVGVLAARTGEIQRCIEVGGYLADMTVDSARGKLYVADALNDRIVVISAQECNVLRCIETPPVPWSLTVVGDALFVGCADGKCVVRIDITTDRVTGRREMGTPVGRVVTMMHKDKPALGVWLRPRSFHAETRQEIPLWQENYTFGRRRTGYATGRWWHGRGHVIPHTCVRADGFVLDAWTRDLFPASGGGKVEEQRKWKLDVSSLAKLDPTIRIEPPLQEGPDVFARVREDCFAFTIPGSGRVGLIDFQKRQVVGVVDVGGLLVDLDAEPFGDRIFAVDSAGTRLIQIDARRLAVTATIELPDDPQHVALEGKTVFVACRKTKRLVIIDISDDPRIIRTVELAFEPSGLGIAKQGHGHWGPMNPPYRMPDYGPPRAVVTHFPVLLDIETMSVMNSAPPQIGPRVGSTIDTVVDGRVRKFRADNQLTIEDVDAKRYIDVSALADPNILRRDRFVSPRDTPGAIEFSVDGGGRLPWRRDIEFTPDQKLHLTHETEEFRRWNAATFPLGPGPHVLRVHANGPFACLDGLLVEKRLDDAVEIDIRPVPSDNSNVFYDTEEPRFNVQIKNLRHEAQELDVLFDAENYMNEVESRVKERIHLAPSATWAQVHVPKYKSFGSCTLTVQLTSTDGSLVKRHVFLRMPKLEHPRLLFRRVDVAAIQARIAKYPVLFARYLEWLRRRVANPNFLPAYLTKEELIEQNFTHESADYAGWRLLQAQFARMFFQLPPDDPIVQALRGPLSRSNLAHYETQHYHGPFFPGAVEALFDMAAMDSSEMRQRIQVMFAPHIKDLDVLPWGMISLEEPLKPEDRVWLYELLIFKLNLEHYFATHCGTRGGTWWFDRNATCICPFNAPLVMFTWLRSFFGEPRLFEKRFFNGYLTWFALMDSSGRRLPGGGPRWWTLAAQARHPFVSDDLGFAETIRRLNGPIPGDEARQVDEILKSYPAECYPLALALGWIDPESPTVKREDLPPTLLFDADGEVAMRAGQGDDHTVLTYRCGPRDWSYRYQPQTFELYRSGQTLIGMGVLYGDDGQLEPAWGNTVVFGKDWPWRWNWPGVHVRLEEYPVVNLWNLMGQRYCVRDRRQQGFHSLLADWAGGLGLHGHWIYNYVREGSIVAYETSPRFDYVAGDSSNAWTLDEARQVTRQIVFIKPDYIVIYDRAQVGQRGIPYFWQAAIAPQIKVSGETFAIGEYAKGRVLLPLRSEIKVVSSRDYYGLFSPGQGQKYSVLQVHPVEQSKHAEFLVVLGLGEKRNTEYKVHSSHRDVVGVEFGAGETHTIIRFRRVGAVGGQITIQEHGKPITCPFAHRVEDHYEHYAADPRYKAWMTEPRFRFIIGDHRKGESR